MQEKDGIPEGNLEISARNQQVGRYANDALSGNVRLSGQKGDVSYSAHGLLTTQEDPRLQPQNRFGASLYIGDWLDLEAWARVSGFESPERLPASVCRALMQASTPGMMR
ncbi:MAG: hypothetical protein U5J63_17635 [Fodinibius sp.]|nr:hypothetical protein [Fodinibius sp.]